MGGSNTGHRDLEPRDGGTLPHPVLGTISRTSGGGIPVPFTLGQGAEVSLLPQAQTPETQQPGPGP